jgi:ABC-type polysaccharide/polyol phosphate transport system ATPase subunit
VVFDGVWKSFRRGERLDALRDAVPAALGRLLGRRRNGGRGERFWALQDVSFQVGPGEVLGVIGPNGAGKSTLLRLATGILRPEAGRVAVRGRVAALIEVAAGFHEELTGRENLRLQGALMGMGRDEVARRQDEIVEFAGLADFIDTPVKRYSSGMRARLGFSIAAHLDPDVLLVDEVLAVGDYDFQRRAFARLEELVRRDIPVIVVSHQVERLARLCTSGLLLSAGHVVRYGTADECVADYVAGAHLERDDSPAAGIRLDGFSFCPAGAVRSGEALELQVEGSVDGAGPAEALALRVRALPDETHVFVTDSSKFGIRLPESGPFRVSVTLQMNMGPGIYRVQPFVWDSERRCELSRGPSLVVRVDRGETAFGPVNLRPRMRLES